MDYIRIGKIVNTHGLKGELKVQSYSDFDRERYKKGNTLYILYEGNYIEVTASGCRIAKGFTFTVFSGLEDINLVEKYKNCEIYITSENRKGLKKGEYYRNDLEGLDVMDEEGSILGKITAVEETNSRQNHIRILKNDGEEVLVPWVPAFVKNVDLLNRKVTLHVIEGLL